MKTFVRKFWTFSSIMGIITVGSIIFVASLVVGTKNQNIPTSVVLIVFFYNSYLILSVSAPT